MFIKNLKIINNEEKEKIQDIDFNIGANFVVDAGNTEKDAKHNKVGKTTFLKLIDIALGSKEKKGIYTDDTTGINEKLKNYIFIHKTSIILIISNTLSKTNKDNVENPIEYKLEVDLFPNGRQYINNEKYNQKNYQSELKNILFNDDSPNPSFRQLISSFVRISTPNTKRGFLHNLISTSNSTYRGIYNFLFDIPAPENEFKRSSILKELNEIDKSEKYYKKITKIDSANQVTQIIESIDLQINDISKKLNDIISIDDFENNRNKIENVRQKYSNINHKIHNYQFRIERINSSIDELNKIKKTSINQKLTEDFFNEMQTTLPSMEKTFNELVNFNNKLNDNKLDYLSESKETLEENINELIRKKSLLLSGNSALISLVKNNKINEYTELQKNLSERTQEKNKNEQILDTIKSYSDRLEELNNALSQIPDNKENSYLEETALFNKYFTNYSQLINKERPYLTYVPLSDKNKQPPFPLEINNVNGTGTGTEKTLAASYDLAYQSYAHDKLKTVPNFIIHDVMENIEGTGLLNMIKISNSIGTQFIFAVLKEKLDSSGILKKEQKESIIISLSKNNKLFPGS